MIGKPAHLCSNCMSREICPLRGRPCDGVFQMLEKNRKLGGDRQ